MFEWVFRDSPDAILLTAPDGRIFLANRAATTLFGWSEEEIYAGGRELLVDTSDPRLALALRERQETGRCRSALTFRHRDGTRFPADVSSAVFETRDGPRTAMVIRDLRPQRELEAGLARERERYRLLAENARDIVYRYQFEPRRGFEYVSPAVTRITGYTPEEHYANPDLGFERMHPDDRPLLEAMAGGASASVVLRWLRKDGAVIWTEHSTTAIRDQAGRVIAIEGIARDVTDRKKMEAQLEHERASLRLLSDASASMARSLDFEATLAAVARAAVPALADYCVLDLLDEGGEFQRIVAAAADPEKEAEMRSGAGRHGPRVAGPHPAAVAIATQKPVVLSSIPDSLLGAIVSDDATLREVKARSPVASAIAVPLTARGRCFGALLLGAVEPGRLGPDDVPVVEELGRRASQFLDNARLYGEAQRALAGRDEVLAVVAHDLRNPLNAIGLRAQHQLGSTTEPAASGAARSILHDVNRMNALIQDLLDVARNEAGVLRIERALEAPERIAADAREMFQALADAASVEFVVRVEPGLPSIRVDRKRMLQAISNLVGNALKFAAKGTTVRLEITRGEGEVCFCVSDQGPGIPPEQLGRVFDRFWKGAGAQGRGLGLGLSITRALVEMQGGRVWVESEVGVGTRMHFAIRSQRADLDT